MKSHLHSFLDVDALLLVQTSTPPATTNNTRGKYEKKETYRRDLFVFNQRIHLQIEQFLISLTVFSLSLPFYLSNYLPCIFLFIDVSLSPSDLIKYLSVDLPTLPTYYKSLSLCVFVLLSTCLFVYLLSVYLSISGAVSFKEM